MRAVYTRHGWSSSRRHEACFIGNVLLAGLALSVPVGATMLASKIRTGSALTGFRAIGVALGVRPSRRHVGRKAALLGGGMLAAGLLVMLGLGMRPVLVRTQE